ncbi:MAG: hypothetical protein OK457_06205, partial [Thaumarchaeota archaeon]|nr:hypothetical protein [Nitrososphaerota archaeon]
MSGGGKGIHYFSLLVVVLILSLLLSVNLVSPSSAALGHYVAHSERGGKPASALFSPGQLPAKSHNAPTLSLSNSSLPTPNYDEQLGLTFTQAFTSLSYNVTAIVQEDSFGYGPAYLLNGLSNKGYWYQVGLSWDWPFLNGGFSPGFGFNFEAFSYNGSSIFPANSGGLDNFSGSVRQGDIVGLSLSFSGTNVSMKAIDWSTNASAQEQFAAFGASSFVGSTGGISNAKGFFTGLMTEEYHTAPFTGPEKKVVYTNALGSISSAWMWVDEFNANTSQVLFYESTPSPVLFSRDPFQLHYFFSNGSTLASNSQEFFTGSSGTVLVTLGYSVVGSPSGFSPVVSFVSNGTVESANLEQYQTGFLMDIGSLWTASNVLPKSSMQERWVTPNSTTGIVSNALTLNFVYYHQFLVAFSFTVVGGGSNFSNPVLTFSSTGRNNTMILFKNITPIWIDAGSTWNTTNPLGGSAESERWYGKQTSGFVSTQGTEAVTYIHQTKILAGFSVAYGGSNYSLPYISSRYLNATFNSTLTTTATPLWLDTGAPWTVDYLLPGSSATQRWEALTFTGTVSGGSISPLYYHQKLLGFAYAIIGGGSGYLPPQVNVTTFGTPTTILPNSTYWVDYLSGYTYPPILSSSSSSERWISTSAFSGQVLSQQRVQVQYQNQFFLMIVNENNAKGGLISPASGWYNAGDRTSLSALSDTGWQFFGWLGKGPSSYTGNATSAV